MKKIIISLLAIGMLYPCLAVHVDIPEGTTSIGYRAYADRSDITSITIPDSVTSIGDSAFRDCSGLTSVTIPSRVLSIGMNVFNGCSGLKSVTIPDSVTSIGKYAFYNCSGLESVTMPSGVTSIGDYAFYGCSSLTSEIILDSVTSIGVMAFYGCNSLTSVTIPSSVTSVGSCAFKGCQRLADSDGFVIVQGTLYDYVSGNSVVTIPDSVTSIGDNVFRDGGLTSVTIPNSVKSIGDGAFYHCSGLTTVEIPNSVTKIGAWAFACNNLTSVTLSDSVTSIGDSAFQSCSSLTAVEIPNSVTTIGGSVFLDCNNLTSVEIPSSVTSIGWGAFSNCSSLKTVFVDQGDVERVKALLQSAGVGVDALSFVEVLAVTKVAPFGLAIDYINTMTDAATTTYTPVITATATVEGSETAYTATTLTEPHPLDDGKYRVYWNMAKDGVPSLEGATIAVTLKEELPAGSTATPKESNTKKVKNVTTSVIVDGATVTDTLTIDYLPTANEPVSLWVDGAAVVASAMTKGQYEYRPTENRAYTIYHIVKTVSAALPMSVTYNFNLPPLTVSDVSVQAIKPFGLAIDYTVDNVMAGAEGYVPEVTLTLSDGITKYTAKTLTGDMGATAGDHRIYWNLAKDGIASFEGGEISVTFVKAPYCVIDLSGGANADSYPVTYLASEPEGGFNTDEYKKDKLVLKRVDAGSFIMGEDQSVTDHKVTLTKPFYMALFETTQKQWELVMGENSSNFSMDGEKKPVECVSYAKIRGTDKGANWPTDNKVDSESFLGKLRARTGNLAFDLPTEAQWEYACRAGTKTKYNLGDKVDDLEQAGWYVDNSEDTTHEVGTKQPNAWGLYDMHGSVWEWCLDWYGTLTYGTDPKGSSPNSEDSYRVYRGGSWITGADNCSSSYQGYGYPSYISISLGFRLSRTITATPVTPATSSPVSATVLTNGSKVSEEVTIDCAPILDGAVPSVTVTVNGDEVDTSSGSYAWLPNKVGENKIVYTIDGNTFTVSYDAVERAPVITDVAVTKVAPFGVAIDYTYTMMENATTAYSPVITATDGATVYTAKTLSAPQSQSTSENKYRIYWNMAKDGVPSLAGATVSVTLKEKLPEYCVVDLPDLPTDATEAAALTYNVEWTDTVPEDGFTAYDEYKTSKLVLKRINAGEFIMGEEQDNDNHKVTLTQPFYMALFETTQSQWQRVTGSNPSQFSTDGEKKPVEMVSYDAIRGSVDGANWPKDNNVDDESFLGKLRARTGALAFDLPTEAQWEYACRAGTTTTWSFGKDDSIAGDYMWCYENSTNKTHDVGGKKPNAWGLYDMHGNVDEWCLNWWSDTLAYGSDPIGAEAGSSRVVRSGSVFDTADSFCTSASRYRTSSVFGAQYRGFRLALPVEQKSSNTLKFDNVTTSVIVDGDTVTDTITLDYLPTASASVSIGADGVGVVEPTTTKGQFTYRPTENGAHTIEYIVWGEEGGMPVGTTVMSVTYNFNLPPLTVSDVSVQTIKPFGLAIDYTVDNVMAGAEGYVPEVTLTLSDGVTKYTATTLSEPQSFGDNKYRLYWNLAKDGIASFDGATVSVTYKDPLGEAVVENDGAKYCVIDLTADSDAVTFLNEEPEGGFAADDTYKTNNLVLKRVEAGSFIMGEDQDDTNHKVTLTKPFYMALFETTQSQWELVTGTNPSEFKSASEDTTKRPVERVSYDMIRGSVNGAHWPTDNKVDSASFLGKLRERTGLNFDLPTEAQWEYACRAGTTTAYNLGDTEEAIKNAGWYWDNTENARTCEVGEKIANAWGLYDMHGNVLEWCLDWKGDLAYASDPVGAVLGEGRVMRGGAWDYSLDYAASSIRDSNTSDFQSNIGGFRLSRTLLVTPVTPATQTGISATVLTDGSKVSETQTIDCAPFEDATVTMTVNGTTVSPTDGSYAWLPSKVGTNEIVYTIDGNTFTVSYDAVERAPVITDVAVTKVAPFGVAIDYTYTMMENATTAYTPVITATTADGTGETVYTAKTLSAPQSLGENKYRVYWNMAKDGVPSLAGATVSVTLKEKLTDYCVVDLPEYTTEAVSSYNVTWTNDVPEGGSNADAYKTAKLVLKRIDAGEFIMGSEQDNADHTVTLTQPFYMALFETTQEQWRRVTGSNPSWFQLGVSSEVSDDSSMRPVERVSYDMIRGSEAGANWPTDNEVDSTSFLGKLRARTGNLAFDLPTEAQWEYACRAGTTNTWSFGDSDTVASDYMWYSLNSENTTHNVGEKLPNAWGLYDMHGNVAEWCLDWFSNALIYGDDPIGVETGAETGDYRVRRDGDFSTPSVACESAYRKYYNPRFSDYSIGFRLALTVEQKSSNTFKRENVTTSVIVDGETVTEAIDFGYLGAEGASVSIMAGPLGAANYDFVVKNATSFGTQSWQPSKPGEYECVYGVEDMAVLSATYKMVDIPMSFSDEILQSFNYSGVYDGEAHGIALTNGCDALKGIAGARVSYATVLGYVPDEYYDPPFKNAGTNTVFYRIEADGYAPYEGSATVTITPRPVTLQSDTKTTFVYDGEAHEFPVLVKSGNWFVAGEGIATSDWATVTNVDDGDEGVVENTFTYTFNSETLADNYDITVKYGTISVQPLDISGGEEGDWVYQLNEHHIYDGTEWTQKVVSATFKGLPVTFDVTDNKQTNAGTYQMTLKGTGNFTGSRKIAWSIGCRQLVLTAASDEKVYDGTALKAGGVEADGFVDGEGAGYVLNSSRTGYGESTNIIDTIRWNDNTLESNYEVTKHDGTLTIKKRPVTITSESNTSLVYNGKDQTYEVVTIGGEGFVAGEGIVTSNWATVTTVAQGEVANTFDYAPIEGTDLENYDITVVNGTIKVVPKELTENMFKLLNVPTDGYVWDGTAKTPDVSCQDGEPGESSIIGNDDFTVSYSDNVDVGRATVSFTGKNNYTGTVELHFKIVELLADVTFDALGGKIGAAGVVTQTQMRVYSDLPADPTRENYTFEGWYLDVADDTTKAAENGEWLVDGDHTLYAKWAVDSAVLPDAADGVLAYSVNDDGSTVTITGLGTVAMSGTSLVIPDMIDGKYVTEIADKAFTNSTSITSVTLPMFLKRVGYRAFHSAKKLKELNIPSVRDWQDPSRSGSLTIDGYAFAGTMLEAVYLPEEVIEIGEYAFYNCTKLASVTILGAPSVGDRPFRRAGIATDSRPTLHLDPELAADETYLSKLTNAFGDANLPPTILTSAIVESVAPMGVSIDAEGNVELPVAVGRAANWGAVDASKIRVEYSENLTDTPITLVPEVMSNEGDTLSISVTPPMKASSGFFRVKVIK